MSEEKDFDAFYASRASSLVRSVYLATGDLERAQDCVQEAFMRAWSRWDHLDDDPVTWVYTVAWRLAVNDWKRTLRLHQLLKRTRTEKLDVAPPPVEVLLVREAITRLAPEQRATVILYYFEDLPIRTVAKVLGVPEGTIKARLNRARTALFTLVEEGSEPTCRTTP